MVGAERSFAEKAAAASGRRTGAHGGRAMKWLPFLFLAYCCAFASAAQAQEPPTAPSIPAAAAPAEAPPTTATENNVPPSVPADATPTAQNIAMPGSAPAADTGVAQTPAHPSGDSAALAPKTEQDNESAKQSLNFTANYRSIMLSPKQSQAYIPLRKALYSILVARQRGEDAAATAADGTEDAAVAADLFDMGQPAKLYYTYPQFFLESVIYYHPAKWTIWVNGERYTQDSPKEGVELAVQAIDAEKVTFLWKPAPTERMQWDAPANPRVTLNSSDRVVTFTLYANQTFSSYRRAIIEGKVQPAVVNINAPEPVAAAPQATPESAPAPAPEKEPATGLGGLLNRYENLSNPR
jgi:hypothetical protein